MKNKVKTIKDKLIEIYGEVFQIYSFELKAEDNYIVFEINNEYTTWCIDEFEKDIDTELDDIYNYVCDTIDEMIGL